MATGLGIAVGALILRAGEAILADTPEAAPVTGYPWTFAVLGVLMLYPALEALRMDRSAGELVS